MSTQTKERQVLAAAKAGTTDLEQVRPLSPTEREWKQRIYERLLKVLDLSLIGSLGEERRRAARSARSRNRLLLEESAPLSLAQRAVRHAPHRGRGARAWAARAAARGPDHLRHPGQRPDQVYVERRGKLELTERAASTTTRT